MAYIITLDKVFPINKLPPQQLPSPQSEQPAFIQSLLTNFTQSSEYIKLPPSISKAGFTYSFLASSSLEYSMVIELSYTNQDHILRFRFYFLRHGQLLAISSRRNREVFCKLLQKLNYRLIQQNIHFGVSMGTGLVVARHTRTLHFSSDNSTVLNKQIHRIIQMLFGIVDGHLLHLLKFVNEARDCDLLRRNWRYQNFMLAESEKVMEIRELIGLSHLNLGEKTPSHCEDRKFREKQVNQFMQQRHKMEGSQYMVDKQASLFGYLMMEGVYFSAHKLSTQHLLSGSFAKQFDNYFYKLSPKKYPNGENTYLFNTILIKNEENVQTRSINCEGGNSIIQVAEMEISYTQSQNPVFEPPPNKNDKARRKSVMRKQILLQERSPQLEYIPKAIAIKMGKAHCSNEKIKHQKTIVQHLRTVSSPYFLKYYHSIQCRFKHRHNLLMDYIGQFYTLAEYAQLHSHTLFLSSKMHFFAHLANALKFLQDLNITHMDLSTNNIIVTKDLLIKVIDFGEAYNPQECDTNPNYSPGYTLPFCPPQVFNSTKRFSPKSDVFSFGIILYRLIFGVHAMSPTSSLRGLYEDKSYQTRVLLAPEGCEYSCNSTIISLLLQIIDRCLSVDCQYRPFPYWLYVILNKILLFFNK